MCVRTILHSTQAKTMQANLLVIIQLRSHLLQDVAEGFISSTVFFEGRGLNSLEKANLPLYRKLISICVQWNAVWFHRKCTISRIASIKQLESAFGGEMHSVKR